MRLDIRLWNLAAVVGCLAAVGCNNNSPTLPPSTTRVEPGTHVVVPDPNVPAQPVQVKVEAGPRSALDEAVKVDVNPNAGVNVKIDGQPIRDAIRERRIEAGKPVAPPVP